MATALVATTVVGYFVLFPPVCYWVQDLGAAPSDSLILDVLTVVGVPCRWLKSHCQLYQAYIVWCLETSEF